MTDLELVEITTDCCVLCHACQRIRGIQKNCKAECGQHPDEKLLPLVGELQAGETFEEFFQKQQLN